MRRPVWGVACALVVLWTSVAWGYTFDPTVLDIPSVTYGTANEACETPSGADVTLTTGSAWEAAIEGASPGARFFLRTGTYTTAALTLPAGTVNSRITVKAYNCEVVTLNAVVDPTSYTTIAGVITNTVRFARGTTHTGAIVRNNHIRSNGNNWALRNDDDQVNLLIQGNILETTNQTEDWNTLGVRAGSRGTNAVITKNKLLNSAGGSGGEDLIQFHDWSGTWTVSRNWFVQNDEEDFMDIKYSSVGAGMATIQIHENYFNGPGVASQCVMTHNSSGVGVGSGYSYTADVKGNYFYRCPRMITHRISTLPGENDPDGRFLVASYNVFHALDTTQLLTIESHNATFLHNTFLSGNLRPGVTGTNPLNVIVRNNIFYQTLITFGSNIDTCSHNDFYLVTGAPPCASSITSNPLFVNVASDWNLQTASLARNAGSDGLDMGAYGPPSVNITSALELHLKFDETTGSTAHDSTANNHDGTLATGATWGAAKLGVSALTVDGTTDGVVTVSGLLGTTPSVTLAAWFKRSAFPTPTGDILSIGNFLVLRNSATTVMGRFYNGSAQVETAASFASGTTNWQHVVYTFTPGTQRLYLNGILAATSSAGGAIAYTGVGTNTVIGGHGAASADFRFQGSIDDVRVYTRALTESDAAGLYAFTDPPPLSVQITSPTTNPSHSVTSTPLTNFSGIATDSTGVTGVTWTCPTCTPTSGTATCTPACGAATTSTSWQVPTVTVAVGSNLLTVTAQDASGTHADQLTVTYTPPPPVGTCSHYASQAGGGNGLSPGSPFRVVDFWAVASPGTTLCLTHTTVPEVYTGGNSMVQPPGGLSGTAALPITVRALTDGAILLDGQHARNPVVLGTTNAWFVLQGLNARNGLTAVYEFLGDNNLGQRLIGWNATTGQANSTIFTVRGTNSVIEDCAGWGDNARVILQGSGTVNSPASGYRRCFCEWNDHPEGGTTAGACAAPGVGQRFENIVGTIHRTGQ